MLLRPVRWDDFYDEVGRSTIWLVRNLIRVRRQIPELRNGDHFFYNDWGQYQSLGLLLFSRSAGSRFTMVALNFSSTDQVVSFRFPLSGDYHEQLHGNPGDDLLGIAAGAEVHLPVPSNYGRIWRNS
jgi:hypothetical protein